MMKKTINVKKKGIFKQIGDKKSYSNRYILKNIILPNKKDIPHIVLIVAPCRSGTSTLLKSFSTAADMAYYQPIKSILRNGHPKLVIPKKAKTVVIKETLGPWRLEESLMDPLALLLKAGVPKENITLIPLLREPVEAYDSWLKYAEGTNTKLFIAAFDKTLELHKNASKQGIKSIPLAYDLYKKPRILIKSLFKKTGLEFKESSVKWGKEQYGSKSMKLNAEATNQAGYSELILNSNVGEFKHMGREIEFVSQKEKEEITKKLSKRYNTFLKMSKKELF